MKCIVLLDGGHKTTVQFDSPEALLEEIQLEREKGTTAYSPGDGDAWVYPQSVVGVVGVPGDGDPVSAVGARYRLAKIREEAQEVLERDGNTVPGLEARLASIAEFAEGNETLEEGIVPRLGELGTTPGSGAREAQEQDALTIIPTERLFREYLHRVVRRVREAKPEENDYAIVRELRTDIGAD